MNREQIAEVAHEANRAYCQSIGDATVPPWAEASDAHKASILAGVDMHLGADVEPEAAHQAWFEAKLADGWVYGETKNAEKKIHPCMRPYEELPAEQRAKDYIFRGVVRALGALPAEPTGKPAALDPLPMAAVGVKYIGRRDPHSDTLYGSGAWTKGQVKAATPALARLLLKHADVYVEAPLGAPTASDKVLKVRREGENPDDLTQEIRDQVQNMDKAALKDFAQAHFRVKIDGRLSLDDTRSRVVQLIDQYGAQ